MKNKNSKISLAYAYKILFGVMSKKDKWHFAFLTLLALVKCFATVMITQVIACVVAKFEGGVSTIFGIALPSTWSTVGVVIFSYALVAFMWVLSAIIGDFIKKYAIDMSCKVNSKALEYLTAPRKNLDLKMTSGEAVFIAKTAGDSVIYLIKDIWLKVMIPIISCVIALVLIGIIDWICLIIFFVCFAAMIASSFVRLKFEAPLDDDIEEAKSKLNNHYLNDINNLPLITLEKSRKHESKIFERQNRVYQKKWHKVTNLAMIYWIFAYVVEYSFVALGIIVCILGAGENPVSIANIIALISYSGQLCTPLESLGVELSNLQQKAIQLSRLELIKPKFDDLLIDEQTTKKVGKKYYKLPEDIKITNIKLKKMHISLGDFDRSYPEIELKDKCINVISGESGSGKSSIIKALLGIKHYKAGTILINNKYEIKSLYANSDRVSYVTQQPMIFDRSVADNISYPNNKLNDSLANYVDKFELEGIIEREKSNSSITTILSGGEQRRISLIRALAKAAPIYIFDEPTNDLDGENIDKVIKEIKKLKKNSMIIIISHDSKIIEIADNYISL